MQAAARRRLGRIRRHFLAASREEERSDALRFCSAVSAEEDARKESPQIGPKRCWRGLEVSPEE